jgi:hypothetical protein
MTDEEFEHLRGALDPYAGAAALISGDLEDGINAARLLSTAERDGLLAALAEAEADRDRARDAAVALEQQLAEIKKLAYMGGQNGEVIRAAILGVFEGDLHEEAL